MAFVMLLKRVSTGIKLSNSSLASINYSKVQQMSTRIFKSKKSNVLGPIGYMLLIIPTGTFCLGTWQIKRYKWKLGLIEELRQQTNAPPVELPENLDDLNSMEYRRVKVCGEFLHDGEMYIRPRSLVPPIGVEETGKGLISIGQSGTGAFVVTPFKLSNCEKTILINRGWVPRNKMSPHTRKEGQIKGEIDLIGIVRHSEKRVPLGPKPNPEDHPFWGLRDIEKMAQLSHSYPIFLDACLTEPKLKNAPIGGQTRVTLRNEHVSYVMTWYSLSAITSFLWFKRFIKG